MASTSLYLARAQLVLLAVAVLYLIAVTCLTVPSIQRNAIYMHTIKWPPNPKFYAPESSGFSPWKVTDVNISSDGLRLGAWFSVSDKHYQSVIRPTGRRPNDAEIRHAITTHPTVLFFHGVAGSRAVPFRTRVVSAYSSRINTNVFTIDYRGFADSEGLPSENGLAHDARAAWDWLTNRGAQPQDILIFGHSLGTAVAARLAVDLALENVIPKGVLLVAPFISVSRLLDSYAVFGMFPILKPLHSFPPLLNLVLKYLQHPWDTEGRINNITAPLMLAHAEDDFDIPIAHSESLFSALLSPHLPALPYTFEELHLQSPSTDMHREQFAAYESQRKVRDGIVHTIANIPHFARVAAFERPIVDEALLDDSVRVTAGQQITYAVLENGGHNRLTASEALVDLVRDTFKFGED